VRNVLWVIPVLAVSLAMPADVAAAAAVTHPGVLALSSGTWGDAEELPGIAALNTGGNASATTVSCSSTGNCGLGGSYRDSSGHAQAYVANETKGTWGKAEEVPGTAKLNKTYAAGTVSVSCASVGNCSAGGYYGDNSRAGQAFVVDETNGTWGDAEEVPGSGALNTGGDAQVESVSCASAGNCSAVGVYNTPLAPSQVFVVSEKKGVWGTAEGMPGLTALNAGGIAAVSQVSCGSAGNCAAGGDYTTAKGKVRPFIENETNGIWHTAKPVPGSGSLNTGGNAGVDSVSCASAGNCSAGGSYESDGSVQAFTVDETDGTWAAAQEIPDFTALNTGGYGAIASVSCVSAGNCSAVGVYTDSSQDYQAFAVSETDGTWGSAAEIPGTAGLNTANAAAGSVSCASAGNCAAVGSYDFSRAGNGVSQAFVVSETDGIWANAEPVPGMTTLNPGGQSGAVAVFCPSPGHCSAVGNYGQSGVQAPFVVAEG
jgi:hypothetical protein